MRPDDERIPDVLVPDGQSAVASRRERAMDNPDYSTGDPEAGGYA